MESPEYKRGDSGPIHFCPLQSYSSVFPIQLFNATKSIARVTNFILGVLLLAHWNGCIQFLVPYIEGFPSDSWVSINRLQVGKTKRDKGGRV